MSKETVVKVKLTCGLHSSDFEIGGADDELDQIRREITRLEEAERDRLKMDYFQSTEVYALRGALVWILNRREAEE